MLENHWRGEIIDTVGKALGLVRNKAYRGIKPIVRKVTRCYPKGQSIISTLSHYPSASCRLYADSIEAFLC